MTESLPSLEATHPTQPMRNSRSRYEYLLRPGSATGGGSSAEATKEYAGFLKEQDRKCGPNGYLDSRKFQYTFQLKGKVAESKGVGGGWQTAPPLISGGERRGSAGGPATTNVVELTGKTIKNKKEHNKKMKLIEDHMWQHKQEERELKRVENDVIKNQHLLRRSMRDYEFAITRKRMAEEKKLAETRIKEFEIQREHVHKRETVTKLGIEKNQTRIQQQKDDLRKSMHAIGELERKYQATLSEIDLRRAEIERMNEDYINKMKEKEVESFNLKKELSELAVALNMESQKGRIVVVENRKDNTKAQQTKAKEDNEMEFDLDKKIKDNTYKGIKSDTMRRKLSADLTLTRAHLSQQSREEGRHLLDTKNKLQDNTNTQRQLQEAALHADLELKNKLIDQKVQAHDYKKQKLAIQANKQRRERLSQQLEAYMERMQRKQHEVKRKEHEDKFKHVSKSVAKQEELEQELYNKVRQSEYSRKQHEQECKRLTAKLNEIRRQNSIKLKAQALEAQQLEKELEQRLLKEKAELYKSHVNREESYLTLQNQRERMKEDKYLLSETEREHKRLVKIGEKTENLQTYN